MLDKKSTYTPKGAIVREIDISKLKAEDPAEIKIFAGYVAEWVYHFILSHVYNREEAEELTQDTLLAALKGLATFKGDAQLKTWVYGIAINKCKDHLKYCNRIKRKGKLVPIFDDEGETRDLAIEYWHPGVQLESQEELAALHSCINKLPDCQREALILAKFDGYSQKEVADILGTTAKAVESLIGRAKQNLKIYYTKTYD